MTLVRYVILNFAFSFLKTNLICRNWWLIWKENLQHVFFLAWFISPLTTFNYGLLQPCKATFFFRLFPTKQPAIKLAR